MELRVSDNGIGIDKQDLPHIFERLYKCDRGRSEKGSGLGLAITHQLVGKLGGTITAASTPKGSPGYLFAGCTVQGTCPKGSVYLGRPWRAYARVFWLDCQLSSEINPAGWDNWNDPANETTAQFGESGSSGPGASSGSRAFGSVDDRAETAHMQQMLQDFRRDFGF